MVTGEIMDTTLVTGENMAPSRDIASSSAMVTGEKMDSSSAPYQNTVISSDMVAELFMDSTFDSVISSPDRLDSIFAQLADVSLSDHMFTGENMDSTSFARSRDENAMDQKLAKFVVSNGLYSYCQDLTEIPFFADLLSSIEEFGSGYRFPDTATFQSTLVPGIEKEVEIYTANANKFLPTTGCTLMINPFILEETVSVDLFAYTIGGLMYIDSIVSGYPVRTFDTIIKRIISTIESLGPEHVVQFICTYNHIQFGNNFGKDHDRRFHVSLGSAIVKKYPWIYWSPCATRALEELIINLFEEITWVAETAHLAGLIYSYQHKNGTNSLLRSKNTISSKVYHASSESATYMDDCTSDIFLLNSLLEEEETLKALGVTLEGDDHEAATVVGRLLRHADFWSRVKIVTRVLKPLIQALNLVYAYGSNIGYFYEAMKKVNDSITQLCNDSSNQNKLVQEISEIMIKGQQESQLNLPIYAAAAFLNPSFVWNSEFVEDSDMEQGLKFLKQLVIKKEEAEAFAEQLDLFRLKSPDLFTDSALKLLNLIHPRKWWEMYGERLPILQKYAVRVLSQPCAASLCDSLHPQSPASYKILRMKLLAMEKFNTVKPEECEIIDLEKVSGVLEYDDRHLRKLMDFSEAFRSYKLFMHEDLEWLHC